MKRPVLKRKKTQWERTLSWSMVGLILSSLGALAVWMISPVHGMSPIGLTMGGLSICMILVSLLYSQKKRRWLNQDLMGSMMSWLFSHVTLGGLGLFFAALHVGRGWHNIHFGTAWGLFFVFVIVVVTGIWWRLVYHNVPTKVQSEIRNYSISYTQDRAKIKLVEIEKLRAGCSAEFLEYTERRLQGEDVSPTFLSGQESVLWDEFTRLCAEKEKHERRIPQQVNAHILLQIWRLIHVPASIAMMILLPIHVVQGVYNTKHMHEDSNEFISAKECASCHAEIYEDWSLSMHAHALISPTNLVQTRADIHNNTLTDNPEIQSVCVNCHSPLAVQVGKEEPVEPLNTEHPAAREGITCVVCHQYKPKSSYGDKQLRKGEEFLGHAINSGIGSWKVFREGIEGGRTMHSFHNGNQASNLYHDMEYIGEADKNPYEQDSSHFCASCHNVHIDRSSMNMNALKLQSIYDEWSEQGRGAQGSCIDCHAEKGHTHQFIGVDYPLDKPDVIAKTRSHREYLLRDAIGLEIKSVNQGQKLSFDVQLTNQKVGHNFPSGFAFARQFWLEVIVTDQAGSIIHSSGVLQDSSHHDLCDQHTMTSALRDFVQGCDRADEKLINLQFVLQDPNGEETPLQHAKGSVSRKRIQSLINNGTCTGEYPMGMGEKLTCTIQTDAFSSEAHQIQVRLLLRNLPPYFLRAMNEKQPKGNDFIDLNALIQNLEVMTVTQVEMSL